MIKTIDTEPEDYKIIWALFLMGLVAGILIGIVIGFHLWGG